jgi:hypothetical protein
MHEQQVRKRRTARSALQLIAGLGRIGRASTFPFPEADFGCGTEYRERGLVAVI